jgi:hypothetical protein
LSTVLRHLDRASASIDGAGVHPYLDQGGGLDQRNLATALGLINGALAPVERPAGLWLYLTDVGWQSPPLAPEVQPANLQTLFQTCEQSGRIEVVCWFQINDNPAARLSHGLCLADYTPKPAFDVFARL